MPNKSLFTAEMKHAQMQNPRLSDKQKLAAAMRQNAIAYGNSLVKKLRSGSGSARMRSSGSFKAKGKSKETSM